MANTAKFSTPPPTARYALLSFPTPEILLVTLNRPDQLNCINMDGHVELDAIWSWLDAEPTLRVGIVTGAGRAFCAGADLKEWNTFNATGRRRNMPASGFAALSRRTGKKPIIAAVNGLAFGGGMEAAINCDLVVAARATTRFALPEVRRGVVAIAGALPRLVRTVGRQRAMEMALTGRALDAEEGMRWGFVNRVVEGGSEDREVVKAAVELAKEVAANSPDAVIVSREGIKLGWEGVGADEATRLLIEGWYPRLVEGENIAEGVRAFVEKRQPEWKPSKL
ncbi:MAG: hypothetical protein M1822_004894 [Bathelium mastoideum]|nr:MAG: hypothetical protein M1822_004894 [Bathelium mastoideum]